MKRLALGLSALALFVAAVAGAAAGDRASKGIVGDYVEARTSDIYTGPCFANSEMNLAGKEAILAWQVRRGSWGEVPLDGLGVVAIVRASATLGDPYAEQLPARSVLVVDETASVEQRDALVALAREMGGALLDDVVVVDSAPVRIALGEAGFASVSAGDDARIRTRALGHGDHLCGNEEVYYPPLVELDRAQPAVTLEHTWAGEGLGTTWKSPDKRSAFVGTFAR
jgi:hypothetical protein